MKKYFSLREISQELDIPKSTLVKYKDFFSEYLPFVGDGKRKKLPEEGVAILREIRDLREKEKIDWLEIKDIMSEKYGSKRDSAPAPVEVEAAGAAAAGAGASKHIEHLNHLMYSLAGEIVRNREYLAALDDELVEANRRLAALDKKLGEETVHNRRVETISSRAATDAAWLRTQLDKIDNKNKRRIEVTIAYMRAEFHRLREAIAELETRPRETPDTSHLEALSQISAKIQKIVEEAALYQSQYKLLKQENLVLRKKLSAAASKTPEKKSGGSGIMEIFKRKK